MTTQFNAFNAGVVRVVARIAAVILLFCLSIAGLWAQVTLDPFPGKTGSSSARVLVRDAHRSVLEQVTSIVLEDGTSGLVTNRFPHQYNRASGDVIALGAFPNPMQP